MGKFLGGRSVTFVGKVGTVVGSTINGKPYLKGPYKRRTKKISEKERANRVKFALAQAWLRPVLKFVREGFRGYSETAQGFIAAKSYLLKNAMSGTAPNFLIDPALVKLSYGNLEVPQNITVAKTDDNHIQFTWDTTVHDGHANDQAMMLAYIIERRASIVALYGQCRHMGTDKLKIVPGHTYHIYFAMNAHDRSRQSDSVYLGTIAM